MSKETISSHNFESKEHVSSQELLPPGSKILIVSDGSGTVNGVDTLSRNMTRMLTQKGYDPFLLSPYTMDTSDKPMFALQSLPFYPEFKFVRNAPTKLYYQLEKMVEAADSVLVLTPEGPLGFITAIVCQNHKYPYTAVFTTRIPEHIPLYIEKYTRGLIKPDPRLVETILFPLFAKADTLLVPTPSIHKQLKMHKIDSIVWPRGVDTEIFHPPEPEEQNPFYGLPWYQGRPIIAAIGRVSQDKNLKDFLSINDKQLYALTGIHFHKVLIGDGPERSLYEANFPDTIFMGSLSQTKLAHYLRHIDLHIFPSIYDTFGQVINEAGASGTPTVGYRGSVDGKAISSQDVILEGISGITVPYGTPLLIGIPAALQLDRAFCAEETVKHYSLEQAYQILLKNLHSLRKS